MMGRKITMNEKGDILSEKANSFYVCTNLYIHSSLCTFVQLYFCVLGRVFMTNKVRKDKIMTKPECFQTLTALHLLLYYSEKKACIKNE